MKVTFRQGNKLPKESQTPNQNPNGQTNPKYQIPIAKQVPSTKPQRPNGQNSWCLVFAICLGFGIWDLVLSYAGFGA
jgi:hypothetical protein